MRGKTKMMELLILRVSQKNSTSDEISLWHWVDVTKTHPQQNIMKKEVQ